MLDTDELVVTIEQMQSWQYFNMPIDLQVVLPEGTLEFTVDNQGQSQEYNLGLISGSAYSVRLDPDNWILKEVEYLSLASPLPDQAQLILYPAYPNPFNPETSILYYVPNDFGEIEPTIHIYDLTGRLVYQVYPGMSDPGLNRTFWHASGHVSGTYFIQLEANNSFYQQKIQLIK